MRVRRLILGSIGLAVAVTVAVASYRAAHRPIPLEAPPPAPQEDFVGRTLPAFAAPDFSGRVVRWRRRSGGSISRLSCSLELPVARTVRCFARSTTRHMSPTASFPIRTAPLRAYSAATAEFHARTL